MLDDIAQRMDHGVIGVSADLQQQIAVAQAGIQRIVREARHALQPERF